MGKAGYKKFLKSERAKVKLKSKTIQSKTLLPKGQNVTDLNFKVKKIVIKNQLKEHEQSEVLSTRKLNLQEVLSRLNHYSGSVATEAVSELDSLIKQGGNSLLLSNLSSVVSQLAKLLTSSYSHLRKAAIKQLSSILSQINESEWLVIKGMVVSYIVCGLSHVDSGVRIDSLSALDSVPTSGLSVQTLLPSLLDVLSISSSGSSNRSLSHVSSSPVAYRASVLARIQSVLTSLQIKSTACENDVEVSLWKEGGGMRVPISPMYPLTDGLSISEFTANTANVEQHIDLQDFASSLVPLMMDSFVEIAPEPDDSEPVSYLSQDGMRLLGTIADIILLLNDLISTSNPSFKNWLKDKFGVVLYKRMIESRFPYSIDDSKGKKKKDGPSSVPASSLRVNLTLALLCLSFTKPSCWSSTLQYLSELLRNNKCQEETELLGRCLEACFSQSNEKTYNALLSSLTSVNRSSPLFKEVFKVLSKLSLTNTDNSHLTNWVTKLLDELASNSEPFHSDTIEFIKQAAPITNISSRLNTAFTSILDKAMKLENGSKTLLEISCLLYWLDNCDERLLNSLSQLIQNHPCEPSIKTHVLHLLIHKCERYPDAEISKKLVQHSYFSRIIQVYHG